MNSVHKSAYMGAVVEWLYGRGCRVVIDAVVRVPGWQRSGALVTGFEAPRPPLLPASQGRCKSHRLPCVEWHERR